MKKIWIIVLAVVVVLGGFAYFNPGNLLSIIGFGVDELPNCEIGQDPCVLQTQLREGKIFSSYYLKLQIDPFPEANFGEYKPILYSSKSARLFEEKTDRDPREEEWETVYMYTISDTNVYGIAIKAEATGTATSSSSGINSGSKFEINGISTRYEKNNIVTCYERRSSDCRARYGGVSNQFYTIRDYRGSDGDDDYTIANDVNLVGINGKNGFESMNSDDYVFGTSTGTELFSLEASIESDTLRKDSFFLITGNDIERGSQSSITAPTNVQYAVKHLLNPLSFSYSIGGTTLDTLPGETSGEILTLDIADQLNDYCGRTLGNGDRCVIDIEFNSANNGGHVTVLEEIEVLKIYTPPVVIEPINQTPTGDIVVEIESNKIDSKFLIAGIVFIGAFGLFAYRRYKK